MVQRILDQRYELEELIGGGGMADVYKAKDRLLNRPVAVKILHEAFKQDKEFIDKFQREAQAAARLSHPNIVNIYDVGVADGDHYIVMEYVPGSTLKDRIRQEGHLSVSESLRVAREIAEALAHAHANNLVHCDIKPHNILMMADGHAKVADFGIARAVTESTMTYSGNVIGSVHYFSPEQAKGTMITPKSDVYSLGVVLYEMLTGKLPFIGENPVSIAVKHLQEEPVPVRQIDPAIPPVVEAIVSKAMSKDPAMRPTSAEFVQDISQAERMLMAGTPQTPAMMAQDPDATQVLPRVQPVQQSIPPRRAPQNEVYEQDEPEQEKSIFKSKQFIAGLLGSTAEVTVPDVTGKQMTLARQILEDKKLRVNVAETYNADVPAGQVVSQNPTAGSKVKEQRLVTIYVSKGGEEIEMPDLTGLSKSDAAAQLKKMGLKLGSVYEKYSNEEAGTVIKQDPKAGTKISRGQTVDITVSKGKQSHKVSVPDVTGVSLDAAKAALQSRGLRVGSVSKQESRQAAGTVISQSPASGEVEEGSSISLVIAEPVKQQVQKPDKKDPEKNSNSEAKVPSKQNENGKER